jgi:tRNA(adenine34) deaminase
MLSIFTHDFFMKEALKEAQKAADKGEIPVGAIVVLDQQIVARAHNLTEQLTDVTAHAEMLAITAASNYLGAKYLKQATLYVTLEPCVMCAGAIAWAQVGTLVIGATDAKRGFLALAAGALHPKTAVLTGVLAEDCSNLMTTFFRKRR